MNPHLALEPVRAGVALRDARRAAVLLHGRDQDETVMLDVVRRLNLDDVAYLLPVASEGSWYPGRYFDPLELNEPQLDWSLEAVDHAVDLIHAAGLGDEQIVLGGFSQGASIVAEYVARRPRSFAGVAVLTGSLIGEAGTRRAERVPADLRMFFSCAREDDWIAIEDARETAELFRAAGARTEMAELDDPEHHISDAAVAGLRALLV